MALLLCFVSQSHSRGCIIDAHSLTEAATVGNANERSILFCRQLAAVALSVSLGFGLTQEASALVEGYSPMEALKNKDYGKSRMRCATGAGQSHICC
jgi:hypothetical protein